MRFDEKAFSKHQRKIAQKFIDSVLEGSQLEHPPLYRLNSINFDEEIAKLEFQKFEKNEKEIKKINRMIKDLQYEAKHYVKVVFEFNENPKILICRDDFLRGSTALIPRYSWVGVLDFPITSSFLFGRVAKTEKSGGGKFYFAPFDSHKSELYDNLEYLEENSPELFPYDVIGSKRFIKLIGDFKSSKKARNLLRRMRRETMSGEVTRTLVDNLNLKDDLIKLMKKIPHFGRLTYMNMRLVSEIDVSTFFIPYKGVTYFHIEHYVVSPKTKHFRAIMALLLSLEQQCN